MKKLKLTKIITCSLVISLILALNSGEARAEWKQDSNGWWNTEGNSWSVGWRLIDGKWYYFLENGYMAHDVTMDGYKLGSDGAWVQYKQNSSTEDKKVKASDNSISTKEDTNLSSNNTAIQSEFTSEGITMKLEKGVYELGTKDIKFYITNNTSEIRVCPSSTAVSKFENNKWHTLTQFTDFYDKVIVVSPNKTAEGFVSLNALKDFKKLTPGKYMITKSMNSTNFKLEFELK